MAICLKFIHKLFQLMFVGFVQRGGILSPPQSTSQTIATTILHNQRDEVGGQKKGQQTHLKSVWHTCVVVVRKEV